MTRLASGLVALAVLVAIGPACGKYGKPVRTSSAAASVSAQPGAAAPAGEACEDEEKEPQAP